MIEWAIASLIVIAAVVLIAIMFGNKRDSAEQALEDAEQIVSIRAALEAADEDLKKRNRVRAGSSWIVK